MRVALIFQVGTMTFSPSHFLFAPLSPPFSTEMQHQIDECPQREDFNCLGMRLGSGHKSKDLFSPGERAFPFSEPVIRIHQERWHFSVDGDMPALFGNLIQGSGASIYHGLIIAIY